MFTVFSKYEANRSYCLLAKLLNLHFSHTHTVSQSCQFMQQSSICHMSHRKPAGCVLSKPTKYTAVLVYKTTQFCKPGTWIENYVENFETYETINSHINLKVIKTIHFVIFNTICTWL